MSTTNPLNNVTTNTGYAVGTTINPDGTTKAPSTDSSNGLDANSFLQLLVAELKYQDPSNPADPTQMMSQTAQFSQLQALQSMQTSMQSLLTADQSVTATSLLGKSITGTPTAGGNDITGVVTSVKLGTSGPVLKIGDTEVNYSSVKEVTSK